MAAAFPQLEILELIGQGGMGFVFKARQSKLERLVALKILPQSLGGDPAFAERFAREGRVLARLNHPNIVTVHDFGQANGFFYLLMEFVDGVNLRQAMKVGRFTSSQALAVVPKICEALQFAHDEGVLHRDIKPENILLDSKGRVKIADFGIAKLLEMKGNTPAVSPSRAEGIAHKVNLTETGKTIGTPHYMAPEQIEHPQDVDQRADVYSLGVVFYEMLTGELPIGRFAPPSEKSTVDPRVDEVVLRTLEKERERRTRTAGEVKTQVETIATTPQRSEQQSDAGRQDMPADKAPRMDAGVTVRSLAVWSAILSGLAFVSPLLLRDPSLLFSYGVPVLFMIRTSQLLGFVGPVLGAMTLWQFGRGIDRRGLGIALFGTFLPIRANIDSGVVMPSMYLLFPSVWSLPQRVKEFRSWLLLLLLLLVEFWILDRVWKRVAVTSALAIGADYDPERRRRGTRDVIDSWKAIAWLLVALGVLELTPFIGYLWGGQEHAIGIHSYRAAGDLFAGLALLTLRPRWRTAAIVMLWFGAVVWAFGIARIVNAPDFAIMGLAGMSFKFSDQPLGYITVAVIGLGLVAWPYWLLTSQPGRAVFGIDSLAPKTVVKPGWAKRWWIRRSNL